MNGYVVLAAVLTVTASAAAWLGVAIVFPQLRMLPAPVERRLERTSWPPWRHPAQTPPRAHGGAGEPRTPEVGHETGARRLTLADRLTIPLRMRRSTGWHAKPLELRWDPDRGRYIHPDTTGPLTILITSELPYVKGEYR